MSKKFIAGIFAVATFAIASVSFAAYDFGATTLKVGSRGEAVNAVQTVVGATPVDGIFGNVTKAKVMVWQAANGLTADGLFGNMSKAKANAGAVVTPGTPSTPSTPSTGLSGGAGDLTVTGSSKNIEGTIKEGDEEKVLAFKVEAEDSDIKITNAKLELKNNSSTVGSEKLADYVDSVKVYLGSTEVGSVDASDFARESGSPDVFTKSLALSNAVISEGESDYLYVAVAANSDIDSSDIVNNLKWSVKLDSVRFVDGTGAIMTDDVTSTPSRLVDFKLASDDDSLKIKTTSSNPDDATVRVDEDKTTDDVLALAFKLDVDDDSSDMDLQTIKVTADTNIATLDTVAKAEALIDSVVLKIAGEEFDAEDLVTADVNSTGNIISYTFDIDGDVTINAGDVEEAKVYVSFYKQGTAGANYDNDTTVKFAVDNSGIKAEVDGDSVSSSDITGSQQGAVLTLNSSAATVTNMKWAVSTSGTIIDFFFTVDASDDDFTVLDTSVVDSTAGNATYANSGAPELTKYSGTATATGTNDFLVNEGDNATFRLRYTLTATAADNGKWAEVTVTSVAGQTVSEDKETSPTATVNL